LRAAVLAATFIALFGAAPAFVDAQAGDASAGKAVYQLKCVGCHGEKGDGKGPAAELLVPQPRDFTSGIYKIRTTAGKAPSDQDLFRIITDGMPGTSMPSWAVLPEKERWNLVAYIKAFAADKFKEAPKKLELPKEVASSAESIKRGKEMFEAIECNKCHGTDGRADGPSRAELKDEWGHPIAPANLTKRWTVPRRPDANRDRHAPRRGVLGTPMPTFIDSVEKPEDIWHLTNYILSLGPDSPHYATLVTVTAVSDAIPDDPNAEFWKKLTPNNIPLMGQVIVDPRNFNPSIDLVSVRAVYNDKEIAFHLTWDDPTQSTDDPAKKLFADAISLQFPPQPSSGTERPYFPDGRRLGRGLSPALGERQERDGVDRERSGEDRGDPGGRGGRQSGVRERPVSPRDEAPARVEGRHAPDVLARGVHAGRVPGLGRRSRGERDSDVADIMVLSAAGGAAVGPSFRHSSGRSHPHIGGDVARGASCE
jgi:mono/diheme cytochrome c family protein